MSSDEKSLLHRIEELETRIERMEHQLNEQGKKIECQNSSIVYSHSQQQGPICSVKGCNLLAVATCEHGVTGIFSDPCGKRICIHHVTKRRGGFGNSTSTKEYCPIHG